MTREEAIFVLKGLMKNPLFSEVYKAAFSIAIHDIKQYHDWDINNLILINKENYEQHCQHTNEKFEWCTDCREYDQEKHCCHRWSKVIRNTVDEMKQEYIEREALEYIEREVLDELRAEITTLQHRCYALTKGTMCAFCGYECEYKAENNS